MSGLILEGKAFPVKWGSSLLLLLNSNVAWNYIYCAYRRSFSYIWNTWAGYEKNDVQMCLWNKQKFSWVLKKSLYWNVFVRDTCLWKNLLGVWATEVRCWGSLGDRKEPARERRRLEISKRRTNAALVKLRWTNFPHSFVYVEFSYLRVSILKVYSSMVFSIFREFYSCYHSLFFFFKRFLQTNVFNCTSVKF